MQPLSLTPIAAALLATVPLVNAAADDTADQVPAAVSARAGGAPDDSGGVGVVRSRLVHVDMAVLAGAENGQPLHFDLFEEVSLTARVTRRRERTRDRFTLAGELTGEAGGDFLLAVNRGAVAGLINARDLGTYRLRSRPIVSRGGELLFRCFRLTLNGR